MASVRRRVNYIGRVRTDLGVTSNQCAIKKEIVNLFEKLYQRADFPRPTLEGLSFPTISPSSKIWLEREFKEEEIKVALSKCGGDKVPGPDGFNFSFIHVAWDIIKKDFREMLSEFHKRGISLRSIFVGCFLEMVLPS